MDERTVTDIEIAAPADAVWAALREREQLARWFGWDYDGLEDEIEEIFFASATEVEPGRVLDTGDGVFVLEPRDGATGVRVTRTEPPMPDRDPDPIDAGWQRFAGQLRDHLEGRPVNRDEAG